MPLGFTLQLNIDCFNLFQWMFGFAANLGKCSAMAVEIWGVWHALRIAWEKNVRKVILELDSLLVVQIIQGGQKSMNVFHSLVADIQRMLSLNWEVKIFHVMREANRAADCLANIGNHLPLGFHVFDNALFMV